MIHVIDASALLALCRGEPGAERVAELLHNQTCVASSVNLSEVAAKLLDWGLKPGDLADAMSQFQIEAVPFDAAQALVAAQLRPLTRSAGLGLGDRACLGLAKVKSGCAVTADRVWEGLSEAVGVGVVLVR